MALVAALRTLKLLITDPAAYSARRYATSSAMYLSAVMPETWREDVGPKSTPKQALASKPKSG